MPTGAVITSFVFLLIIATDAYRGIPPPDRKLTDAVMKRNPSIIDYQDALIAGLSSYFSSPAAPPQVDYADEDSPFWMNLRREEWRKQYDAKLAEVKNKNAPYSKVPKGMFWNHASGIPISSGYKPVPEDKRHAEWKKKWGVQTLPEEEYWFHPAIHTFGNTGFLGSIHSVAAPLATKLIDNLAYEGRSVREEIGEMLKDRVGEDSKKIIDMGCGVGISTRALAKAFSHPTNTVVGLDTSSQMLQMAKVQTNYIRAKETFDLKLSQGSALKNIDEDRSDPQFIRSNAEKTKFKDGTFDLVTVMYLCHEAPRLGRYKILREARRLLKPGGTLAVIDISPEYEPSASMLSGEPYVLEYQKSIHDQIENMTGFKDREYKVVVPGHVGMWINTRA